jgi:hypothetical protein
MKVVPNFFFSFSPNTRSWHGASIVPEQLRGIPPYLRRTFLGFVTSVNGGFHHFTQNDYNVKDVYYI